ncbi:hypothetical protein FISHEDRAFT_44214, partial [Fistulina hepatica ATCC 64428]
MFTRRGYHVVDSSGGAIKDPYRRGLSQATQWYDVLIQRVDIQVDSAIEHAEKQVAHVCGPLLSISPLSHTADEGEVPPHLPPDVSGPSPPNRERCHRFLQDLCPSCFSGKDFGRPLIDGSDFHFCADGNMSHKHRKSSGTTPHFYDPRHIIPKEFVDWVGEKILKARARSSKRPRKSTTLPDDIVNLDEKAHAAAAGENKSNDDGFTDDKGLFGLFCRHDVGIFLANMDTPGEQQKYITSLLIWLSYFIPRHATITLAYDIACVYARSLELYDILPPSLTSRLLLVTSAMHSYRHEWLCQLRYSPRMTKGLGLSDLEGSERFWSLLRGLIGICRMQTRTKRLWLLDRNIAARNADKLDRLGDWQVARERYVTAQESKMQKAIADSGMGLEELRAQWQAQLQAQTSLR